MDISKDQGFKNSLLDLIERITSNPFILKGSARPTLSQIMINLKTGVEPFSSLDFEEEEDEDNVADTVTIVTTTIKLENVTVIYRVLDFYAYGTENYSECTLSIKMGNVEIY